MLGDVVLTLTPGALAVSHTEVTDPAPIILANVKIVVVRELQTSVTELAAAEMPWLLRLLKVTL